MVVHKAACHTLSQAFLKSMKMQIVNICTTAVQERRNKVHDCYTDSFPKVCASDVTRSYTEAKPFCGKW